jgi:hypothetical protein
MKRRREEEWKRQEEEWKRRKEERLQRMKDQLYEDDKRKDEGFEFSLNLLKAFMGG